jgi:CRP-like cAMP-binding protein
VEAYQALRRHIEQFAPLGDDDWSMLEPHLRLRSLHRHEYMIREGDAGREVGYVLEGELRHYYTRDGLEYTTYFYFENMLLAPYMSCITGQPSRLSIEALSEVRMVVFPYKIMQLLYTHSPAWQRFGRVLAEYLAIGLEERMAGLIMLSPQQRYLDLLGSNKRKILERIPQQYIANYLGITAVSLSRIRNRLTKK